MDTEIMKQWISLVIKHRERKIAPGKKGLLLIDRNTVHTSSEISKLLKAYNFDVKYLPPNTTSKLQPLDVGVNKPFKSQYSDLWNAWIDKKTSIIERNQLKRQLYFGSVRLGRKLEKT
jgi:hypothetical protein